MKCLIVAAGQGVRLRDRVEIKPLVPLKGKPLIEHVIDRARLAGIEDFLVVSGFRGDDLRRSLDAFSARAKVHIGHVVNDEWHRANGVSLMKARPHLTEPFLLTMCDHLVDPQILQTLLTARHLPGSVTLAVDFDLANPLIDPEDVTRVQSTSGQIERIGKLIESYNCYDTGVFLCTPAVFDALAESQTVGDDSISGAVNVMAKARQAYTSDIQGKLWIDVDDAVAFGRAESLLESGRL